jgi:hypothetical protein
MILKINNGFKEPLWFAESLIHVLLHNFEEINQDSLPLETDQTTSPSTEVERQDVASDLEISLDSWLRDLTEESEGVVELGECCAIRDELMLSPDIIGAPLRSVRPDKRALRLLSA